MDSGLLKICTVNWTNWTFMGLMYLPTTSHCNFLKVLSLNFKQPCFMCFILGHILIKIILSPSLTSSLGIWYLDVSSLHLRYNTRLQHFQRRGNSESREPKLHAVISSAANPSCLICWFQLINRAAWKRKCGGKTSWFEEKHDIHFKKSFKAS